MRRTIRLDFDFVVTEGELKGDSTIRTAVVTCEKTTADCRSLHIGCTGRRLVAAVHESQKMWDKQFDICSDLVCVSVQYVDSYMNAALRRCGLSKASRGL